MHRPQFTVEGKPEPPHLEGLSVEVVSGAVRGVHNWIAAGILHGRFFEEERKFWLVERFTVRPCA